MRVLQLNTLPKINFVYCTLPTTSLPSVRVDWIYVCTVDIQRSLQMVGTVVNLPLGGASVLEFVSTPPGEQWPPLRAVTIKFRTQLTSCFLELLKWEGTLPQITENCEQRTAHVEKHQNTQDDCRRNNEVVRTSLRGGLHDVPSSSTRQGASMVSLQTLPLALMVCAQQLCCGPGKRGGTCSSGTRNLRLFNTVVKEHCV